MTWKTALSLGAAAGLLSTLASALVFGAPWLAALIVFLVLNCLLLLAFAHCQRSQCPTLFPHEEEEELPVAGVDPTLTIAHQTLPYMRLGLNEATATKTAEIIQNITEVPAVAITSRESVLAFLGVGCEKHQPGDAILTEATKEVIATGRLKVVHTQRGLNCPRFGNCDCPMASAVIVPLKYRDQVVGSLKLYQTREGAMPPHVVHLAVGLADLLGMQMELAELDRQRQLLVEARLEALNAQINPHFFFNTLNTIISFSRTNPERARRLLIRLADLFRQTLKRQGSFTTLREELEFVRTYLALERARFSNKFRYIQDVPHDLLDHHLPVLSLQPLVENAISHGLIPKEGPGIVKISARLAERELVITVADDGVGIPAERLEQVLLPGYGSGSGVGLSNVDLRFKSLYGQSYGLKLASAGSGTTVALRIPTGIAHSFRGLAKEVASS